MISVTALQVSHLKVAAVIENTALRTLRLMLHKADEWKMIGQAPKVTIQSAPFIRSPRLQHSVISRSVMNSTSSRQA
jgi:hypothetical protein